MAKKYFKTNGWWRRGILSTLFDCSGRQQKGV
jgi:hypothetical protein